MQVFKKYTIVFSSLMALGAVLLGVYQGMQSKLFIVQTIEIESSMEHPPVDDKAILRLASVPIGKANLFQIDLKAIERRLLAQEWIRDVRLEKRLPRTLVISVSFREPRAVFQTQKGGLLYVDQDGKIFGGVSLLRAADLPILTGFQVQAQEKIKEGLELIRIWESSPVSRSAFISSVIWEQERGYRVLATYAMNASEVGQKTNSKFSARTMIDLGHEVDANLEGKLLRLVTVFEYLSGSSIAVRQIWADAGRKIVVKTAHGS
jgi:hypothetical protein